MPAKPLPWPIADAPDPIDQELKPLLDGPMAEAWATGDENTRAAAGRLRGRLLDRLAASQAQSAAMLTTRPTRASHSKLADGVACRMLYSAPGDRALRPGEPLRARLIELAPGSRWEGPAANVHREWLVLRGAARIGHAELALRDYHAVPAGIACAGAASEQGATLFLRESALPARPGDAPVTVRDAEAGWPEFAPGIRRRVLWQRDDQAALLYNAQAGASVPHHTHGHDEECLMVQGELFLDDLLLQPGDYQIAPAGTGHHLTETDTGAVIYAHGDLDLRFVG